MFWPFNKIKTVFVKKIRLVCFDIDNTLCDFSSAESIVEAKIAEVISKDIFKLQSKIKSRKAIKNSCSPQTILRVFNEVKKSHL
jgi:hypothetical protein